MNPSLPMPVSNLRCTFKGFEICHGAKLHQLEIDGSNILLKKDGNITA